MNGPMMDGDMMMDGGQMMDGGMMMACMIAGTLFALVILVLIIVQTVLQAKILGELRRFRAESPPVSPKVETKS